jgi:hypothetical protein
MRLVLGPLLMTRIAFWLKGCTFSAGYLKWLTTRLLGIECVGTQQFQPVQWSTVGSFHAYWLARPNTTVLLSDSHLPLKARCWAIAW